MENGSDLGRKWGGMEGETRGGRGCWVGSKRGVLFAVSLCITTLQIPRAPRGFYRGTNGQPGLLPIRHFPFLCPKFPGQTRRCSRAAPSRAATQITPVSPRQPRVRRAQVAGKSHRAIPSSRAATRGPVALRLGCGSSALRSSHLCGVLWNLSLFPAHSEHRRERKAAEGGKPRPVSRAGTELLFGRAELGRGIWGKGMGRDRLTRVAVPVLELGNPRDGGSGIGAWRLGASLEL